MSVISASPSRVFFTGAGLRRLLDGRGADRVLVRLYDLPRVHLFRAFYAYAYRTRTAYAWDGRTALLWDVTLYADRVRSAFLYSSIRVILLCIHC